MEQEMVRFHDRARPIFFSLFTRFKDAISGINRRGHENVYQQTLAMYIGQLKQDLQEAAQELIGQAAKGSSGTAANELHHALGNTIQEYVHEFAQKANGQ